MFFLHNRQGTSELPDYAFQEVQYGFRRSNTDSGGPIRIQEGQYGFRRANTDSGGPIQIQEGQYETIYGFEEGQYGNLLEIECKSE